MTDDVTTSSHVISDMNEEEMDRGGKRGGKLSRKPDGSGGGVAKTRKEEEGDVSVVFWTSGAVTFSSVVISGLMSKQSGYWECSVRRITQLLD